MAKKVNKEAPKFIGYIRCSTDKQDMQMQRHCIEQYEREHNIIITHWIEDEVSGKHSYEKRKIGLMLPNLSEGDTVIVNDMTRLGRDLLDLASCMQTLLNNGIYLVAIQDRLNLTNDTTSKFHALVLGFVAEMGRKYISKSTSNGLQSRKASGKKYGRDCIYGFRIDFDRAKKRRDEKYKGDIVVDETERRTINFIYGCINQGKKEREITRLLAENKMFARNGKEFQYTQVQRIVARFPYYKEKSLIK